MAHFDAGDQRGELEAFLGPSKYRDELRRTAKLLVATGKGLLACDEPPGVLPGRMTMCWSDESECTEAWRIRYRELMFTTPGLSDFVSGIILHEETCGQKMKARAGGYEDRVPQLLESLGMIPGVKLDGGFAEMPGGSGDWRTAGLDGLRERARRYRNLGLRFAKWRAPLKIDGSETAVQAEADALAVYARVCQDEGLVPIVEPDVVMDGAHGIAASAKATCVRLSSVRRHWPRTVHATACGARGAGGSTLSSPPLTLTTLARSHGRHARSSSQSERRVSP